jgi:dTDP-4-dehydrorhamnose 3,5-epimerase
LSRPRLLIGRAADPPLQPIERRTVDAERPGNVDHIFSGIHPLQRFQPLVSGHFERAPEPHALALARSRPSPMRDRLALEFGKAAQHGQHQPAVGRGGVRPSVLQRAKAGAALGHRSQDIQISGASIAHERSTNGASIRTQHSVSFNKERRTLRGLHLQRSPLAKIKLVQCLNGGILGFAHGFVTLTEEAAFNYCISVEYEPTAAMG